MYIYVGFYKYVYIYIYIYRNPNPQTLKPSSQDPFLGLAAWSAASKLSPWIAPPAPPMFWGSAVFV